MVINRNTLGHLEEPDFILVKASEERVGVLECTHKTWQHKFNDMDTISFEIPYLTDNEETPYYDDIDIMKYIEVPTIGRFCIKDIEIVNEGQKTEYKRVDCQDYSCLIAQKYLENFAINTGNTGSLDGISLAPDGDPNHSLMYLILEKLPEWTFYVAPSLRTMKRSFDISRQDVYSFMTKDISEAFECIFEFDSLNKNINVYEVDSTHWTDTNIHVSYNSLLERTQMNYSVDEIKTAVKLKGSDDLDVREINMGNEYIYSFDYYASQEFMSSSLLTAYNRWKNLVDTAVTTSDYRYKSGVITQSEMSGKSYKNAFTLLLSKYQNYYTQISKWNSTLLPYGINTRKNPGYGTISYTESGSDAITIDKYTSVQLVSSRPSSGSSDVLYLIEGTNNMWRWKNAWVDVNRWDNCALVELKTLLASAEKLQSAAMKKGYGNPNDVEGKEDSTLKARYIDTYLPPTYMYNAIAAQIKVVQSTLDTLQNDQEYYIQYDKNVIVQKTSMQKNFTSAQLKELSSFIREDEITSNNFLVTDVMTETEQFDMLYALLDYGQKELTRVSAPQIQFSADLVNLFAIPEFDTYSGSFDVGNYVWITLRDDYSIKAKILEIELDFLDQSVFNVTFGNIMRKARNIFTDVTDALNMATSAATSVSFNASNWNSSAEQTDSIGQTLADGLLSQAYYLSNNPANNETLIDDTGVWITTVDGDYGREGHSNYDAIYLGGGRILYTQDGWRTVSLSVGRADVRYPYPDSAGNMQYRLESRFGVFADFLIAGYVGGSIIVGGDIYSDAYQTSSDKNSGNFGTHISLKEGTFEFNSPQSYKSAGKPGKKRLRLYSDGTTDILELNGVVHAKEGNIGSDDNGAGGFIIKNEKLYSNKESFNDTKNGIFMGSNPKAELADTNGISLGSYNSNTKRNPFSVDMTGKLVANKGLIANFNLNDSSLYTTKNDLEANADGVYVGDKGIGLGKTTSYTTNNSGGTVNKSIFQVDKEGNLFAGSVNVKGRIFASSGYIGNGTSGFTINPTYIANGKSSMTDAASGIYLGTDGIALGPNNKFSVTKEGLLTTALGKIGGWDISDNEISHGNIHLNAGSGEINVNNKFVIYDDGTFKAANSLFAVDKTGNITAKGGTIGGITIKSSYLSTNGKSKLDDTDKAGVFISSDGISLGRVTTTSDGTTKIPFKVTSAGALTCMSGSIGGWTINPTYLKAKNITIDSTGSIRHSPSSGSSNWSILSSGDATFSSVTINGVHKGSTFGNMGYDTNGYNWGDFSRYAGSRFGSNASKPFSGTCVDHIETISADYIYTKYIKAIHADIEKLDAGLVKANELIATKASIKDLNAATARIGVLEADHVSVKELNAVKVTVSGKITANECESIVSRTLENWSGTLRCGTLYVNGEKCTGAQRVTIDGTMYNFLKAGSD